VSQIFRVSTPALEGDYRKQTLEASLDVVSLQLTSPQSYTLRSLSAPNRVLSSVEYGGFGLFWCSESLSLRYHTPLKRLSIKIGSGSPRGKISF